GWMRKAKKYFFLATTGRKYLPDRDPHLLKQYARQVADRLSRSDADLVFSAGTLATAYLKCRQPIAFWTDATFAGMVNFYPGLTQLHDKTIKEGMAMEQAALNGASLAIYSSEWAARSALEHYKADPNKVKVVSFGANLECNLTQNEIEK